MSQSEGWLTCMFMGQLSEKLEMIFFSSESDPIESGRDIKQNGAKIHRELCSNEPPMCSDEQRGLPITEAAECCFLNEQLFEGAC